MNIFREIGKGVKRAGRNIGRAANQAGRFVGKAAKQAAKAYVATQLPWAAAIFGQSHSPGKVPQGADPTGRPAVDPMSGVTPGASVPLPDAPYSAGGFRGRRRNKRGN